MSNIVNLPTYEQSEQIKQGVENVEIAIENVEIAIENVGNAVGNIQTIVENSGGTDWSKYTPVQSLYTAATSSEYVYEVNGEGFLSTLLIFTTQSSGPIVNVTLEVDGMSNNKNTLGFTSSTAYGFCQPNEAAVNSSTLASYIYPIASGKVANFVRSGENRSAKTDLPEQNRVCILDNPIFYKNKIKVTISWGGSFTANAHGIFVKGGVAL